MCVEDPWTPVKLRQKMFEQKGTWRLWLLLHGLQVVLL